MSKAKIYEFDPVIYPIKMSCMYIVDFMMIVCNGKGV